MFGPPDRSLVGIYHAPESLQARDLTVVLCNPLGYEAMSVHRGYRHLAERLAAQGFPALRFDYDGTGDSAGRLADPGRVRAWIDSIKAAVAEAQARSGASLVALFGVRLGGTLATVAAREIGGVEALMLWAPIVSGRVHARELRAFGLMKKATGATRATNVSRHEGAEVGGYLFGSEMLADLSTVDLLELTRVQGPERVEPLGKRTLLLSRGERPAPDEMRLTDGMKAQGVDVRLLPESGYAKMMRDDPYETIVPLNGIDSIVQWLSEGRYPERRAPPPAHGSRATLSVLAREGTSTLTEMPLLFGERQRLVGVLTEPSESSVSDRPFFIFLNVGANHRVGPQRMNVELARELASMGYSAFRMDAAGLGDSQAAPGVRENRIYTKDAIADVQAAMALLGEVRKAARFVLIGLCSGAYLAYHTAALDPRVVGQVLLSPYAFEWKEGDSVAPTPRKTYRSARFYGRALLDHRVWLRALQGDVEARGIAGALLERIMTRVDAGLPLVRARLLGQSRPQNEVERAFRAMSDRGVETLMILSFDDGGVDMIAQYLGTDARKMLGRKGFEFEILEGVDHSFQTVASQGVLRGKLTTYARSRFP